MQPNSAFKGMLDEFYFFILKTLNILHIGNKSLEKSSIVPDIPSNNQYGLVYMGRQCFHNYTIAFPNRTTLSRHFFKNRYIQYLESLLRTHICTISFFLCWFISTMNDSMAYSHNLVLYIWHIIQLY